MIYNLCKNTSTWLSFFSTLLTKFGLNIVAWPSYSFKISLTMFAMYSASHQTLQKRHHTCMCEDSSPAHRSPNTNSFSNHQDHLHWFHSASPRSVPGIIVWLQKTWSPSTLIKTVNRVNSCSMVCILFHYVTMKSYIPASLIAILCTTHIIYIYYLYHIYPYNEWVFQEQDPCYPFLLPPNMKSCRESW